MPGYEVRRQHITVQGGDQLHIESLLNNQQFHDPDGVAAALGVTAATWPLFGQVWPSACKLADLMQGLDLQGRRVLEMGCGLGLASLVIHRRQGDVTASDCHPLTEHFLQANAVLNALPPMRYQTGHWGHANPDLGRFDLLIGSDVLYERDHPTQLTGFIEEHAHPTAEVMIVDPNRGNRPAFHRAMARLGFDLTESRLDSRPPEGVAYQGRLLHYHRAGQPACQTAQ